MLLLNQVDGVADDANLQHPLDKSEPGVHSVLAELSDAAEADQEVCAIEETKAERYTFDLGNEAQIGQNRVVEHLENDEYETYDNTDYALDILIFDDALVLDGFNEPHAGGAAEARPAQEPNQLRELKEVIETQCRGLHITNFYF